MSDNQEKLNEQLFNVITNDKDSDEARLKKLKYLVRLGADVNARALGIGKSILVFAKESKDEEVVKFLQDKGAIEIYPTKEEAERLGKQFWDNKGDLKSVEEIKELIKKGADVNAQNKYGNPALIRAANGGKLDVVKCLVEHGADLDVCGSGFWGHEKWSALMWASRNGHKEIVEVLLKNGAKVNDVGDSFPLIEASSRGYKEIVEMLLENGVDVNVQGKDNETALVEASYFGYKEIVEMLLHKGANTELKGKNDCAALYNASIEGHKGVVELLLQWGAKVNGCSGNCNSTALMGASWGGYKDVVELLLQWGAEINVKDVNGRTALMLAGETREADKKCQEVVKTLLNAGAKVNIEDNWGKDVRKLAYHNGNNKILEIINQHIKEKEKEKRSIFERIFGGRD